MNLVKHPQARRLTGGSNVTSKAVAPLNKGKLQVQRFVIPYRVYGDAEATLVFINGIHQSMAMWHSFVRRFERRYRIVLFDIPHQGASRIVTGSSTVTLDEQVDILDAVVKATSGAGRPTICSASWGGVVALAYAARHPDRLRNLILASMGMKANQAMIELITRALAMPSKDGSTVAETVIQGVGQELPDAMKSRILGQFQRMSKEAIEAFCQHGLTVISVRDLTEVVDLRKVHCQTMLLHGENDVIIDAEDVRSLAAQIAHAEMRTIKGVGHFLHLEKEEILDVYEEVLASLR
ncbi:MAG: alpha/beta fold hydrolase [Candidatus Binatia bacterium]